MEKQTLMEVVQEDKLNYSHPTTLDVRVSPAASNRARSASVIHRHFVERCADNTIPLAGWLAGDESGRVPHAEEDECK